MSIDLTIVLVTQPSRIAYFREALERIKETLLFQQSIDLLVIFNGKSPLGERYLDTFEVQFQGRISKEIILKNSPMPRDIWNCIRKRKLRWIHMPGDDDLIIHKSYQYFFQTLRQNPKMVGMAFTAVEVDENLLPTGKRLTPFYLEESDCITEKLVHALNRPPFVWPSLIFDSAAVPVDIFDSRFVFDWWVSIQLICNGDIILSKRDLVEYRVHQAQESFQASNSRKYFEAQLMMHQLFVDKSFLTLLNNASNVHQLLKCVNRFPPIYGDPRFGASILLLLLRTFAKPESRKLTLKRHYLAEYLHYSKVEMPLDEFPLSSKDGLLRPFSIQSGDTTILRPDSPSDHMAVNRDLAPWEIIALNSLRRLLRILRMPRKLIFTYIFGRKRH